MAQSTYVVEFSSSIPATRVFKAFLHGDNIITKVLPQFIKSIQVLHGDGGVGTIKLLTTAQGTVKHTVEGIDEEKLSYTYSATEERLDTIDSVYCHSEISATAEGGSISKITCTYTLKGSTEASEENIKAHKEGLTAIFAAVEAYLQANPNE